MEPGDYFYAVLAVEGRRLTTVEGVRAAAKIAIDRHAAAKRQVDDQAAQEKLRREETDHERKRQADVASAILKADAARTRERDSPSLRQSLERQQRRAERDDVQTPGEQTLAARLKRLAYDPWMIGIGTAVIGGIVLALLLR